MKNRRKILISCLVLGSLGGYAFLNLPEKENTEIIKENTVNEEVKKDSVEVAALKNNLEAFKQKELTELDEKYLYYSKESEISNIDLNVYTDSELLELKQNYEKENGFTGTPFEAIALKNKQDHEKEIEELELYLEDKLAEPILNNKEPINMPDTTLKQAIIDNLKLDVDELYAKHLYHLTTLDLSNLQITSLEGLEYAINLEELDLSNAQIEHFKVLKPLGMLAKLKEFNLLGVFKYSEIGGLNYLPDSIETVSLEEFWNTEDYSFKALTYAIDKEESENLESTPEEFFNFEDGSIIGFTNKVDKTLVIPAKIGVVAVEKIESEAFKNSGIETLELPESLMVIGDFAFIENEIEEVTVNTATENTEWAFDDFVDVTIINGGI